MKRPAMIGAHAPKKVPNYRRKGLYAISREFNEAFRKWTATQGRTHLALPTTNNLHPL